MSGDPKAEAQRRYAPRFLADSFSLTLDQAREILASVGDRTAAAEIPRKEQAQGNS